MPLQSIIHAFPPCECSLHRTLIRNKMIYFLEWKKNSFSAATNKSETCKAASVNKKTGLNGANWN